MSEIPLDEASRQVSDAAHDAARGQVVYLTERRLTTCGEPVTWASWIRPSGTLISVASSGGLDVTAQADQRGRVVPVPQLDPALGRQSGGREDPRLRH
jgi:hypothetical protein